MGISKEKDLQVFSESCHVTEKVTQISTIGDCRS